MMTSRLTISEARKDLAELVNRARYAEKVTFLTKHGKDVAAIVPPSHPSLRDAPPPKKQPKRLRVNASSR